MAAAPLSLYIVSFNCGRSFVDLHAFSTGFFHSYHPESRPDLIVLYLQEVAPIAHSFLGGSFLEPYTSKFVDAVNRAAGSSESYTHVITKNVGMTAIVVLAKLHVLPTIQGIETACVGTGVWAMGNKGAVGLRFSHSSGNLNRLTFVAAHLAAAENAVQRRNADWKSIVEGMVFRPENESSVKIKGPDRPISEENQPLLNSQESPSDSQFQGIITSDSLLFFGGDLNYRTSDSSPDPAIQLDLPVPNDDGVSALEQFQTLKQSDQLNRERQAGHTLHNLTEAAFEFAPTYKIVSVQDDAQTRINPKTIRYKWAKHRFPSWCDRILYSAYLQNLDGLFKIASYHTLSIQPTSDHRPVALAFQLDLTSAKLPSRASSLDSFEPPFAVKPGWEQRRIQARRLEVLVGATAYLLLTKEGNALILALAVGVIGCFVAIRSFS